MLGMDVKHINATIIIKGVIQNAIADHSFVRNSDEAVTGCDFTPNKLPPFALPARDEVERAESFYISFNGRANRIHHSIRFRNTLCPQKRSGLTPGIPRPPAPLRLMKSRVSRVGCMPS